jgi:hypothetical protein
MISAKKGKDFGRLRGTAHRPRLFLATRMPAQISNHLALALRARGP